MIKNAVKLIIGFILSIIVYVGCYLIFMICSNDLSKAYDIGALAGMSVVFILSWAYNWGSNGLD